MSEMRLDKFLSSATTYSRRDIKALVKEGRVSVNGVGAKSPDMKIDAVNDSVSVDGGKITYSENVYFMLNKPAGYVSSTDDPRAKTVLELIRPEDKCRPLFPAGRLDKDTEGLLLLTSDGDLCHRVISPKKHVFKTYRAFVDAPLSPSDCEHFRKGIVLSDGTECMPGELEIVSEKECVVKIREGKYHQVKRMLSHLGKNVVYLRREAIGSLTLDESLKTGEYRELNDEDLALIFTDENA